MLFFLVFTIIFTYPLALKMNEFIPGFESTDEPLGVLQIFWQQKNSALRDILPQFFTFSSAKSSEHSYTSPSYYPGWSIAIKLLSQFTNEIFAYNFIVLFSFLLGGVFMSALTFYCLDDFLAALFSGLIYTFSPYHFARAWQHLSLSQVQWFPLYLLSLFYLFEKKNFKGIIFCSLVLLLFLLTDYYYAYFAVLITLIFSSFVIFFNLASKIKKRDFISDIKLVKSLLMVGLVVILLSIPLIYPILKTAFFSPQTDLVAKLGYQRNFTDLFEQSARPLSYFLPAFSQPFLGKLARSFIGSKLYGISLTEHSLYLGLVPIFLSVYAFGKRKKQSWGHSAQERFYLLFFAYLAVLAWLISQPPWWSIAGFKLYMPSFFLYRILPMFRAYCRFAVVLTLALSGLAAFGFKIISQRFKNKKIKTWFVLSIFALAVFEFWNYPPFKVIDVSEVPAAYQWLKAQPGDFTIAEYPLDTETPSDIYRFYQTKHEKKIINGFFPGTSQHKLIQGLTDLSRAQTAAKLKSMGVKYVLVHNSSYQESGLVEKISELKNIPQNPGLKLIKTFPPQSPQTDYFRVDAGGEIDIYQLVFQEADKPVIR